MNIDEIHEKAIQALASTPSDFLEELCESYYPVKGDKHYNSFSDAIAKTQEIDTNRWVVGADVYSTLDGGSIYRIVRITKVIDSNTVEAVLSPRSHSYPEFENRTFRIVHDGNRGHHAP